MLLLVLMSLWASPCFTSSSDQVEVLMDNVVYLEVRDQQNTRVQVPLTCGQSYQDQEVFWRKDGRQLTPDVRGNEVSVVVAEMDGGNYTCHSGAGGRLLNHTLVLVKLDSDQHMVILEKTPTGGAVHCSAPNYDGAFHCKWKKKRSRASVLRVKVQRNQTTIPCTLLPDGSGVQCRETSCSHVEEKHHVSFTLHIRNHARLEEYNKHFFLRDIVRPDKLHNLRSTEESVFRWDQPDTWARPCSFFLLEYQVKVVHEDQRCTRDGHILVSETTAEGHMVIQSSGELTDQRRFKVVDPPKSYVFCVRARDKITSGPWSHWSQCTVSENKVTTC